MVDEQPPAKKVVKRVVKKTVVRPPAPPAEQIRYGRPVAPRAPQAKTASRPTTRPTVRTGSTTTRPRIEVGAKVGAAGRAITSRSAGIASGVTVRARSAGRATGTFAAGHLHALRAWRIPHLDLRLAAVITGLLAGLVSVGLAVAALALFSEVRGVSSGGGRWGSLTFVVVMFVAFVIGELLLAAFGSKHARLTSFLGVILAIVTILAAFLDLADSRWAMLVVPLVGAAAYLVAHWLLTLAESGSTLPE